MANAVLALGEVNGRCFAVGRAEDSTGNHFFEVMADGSSVDFGVMLGDERPQMEASEIEVVIESAGAGYLFTLATNAFAPITGFPPNIVKLAFIDGYFIGLQANSQAFWLSGPLDGASWSGLDFGSAEGAQGNVVSIIASQRLLWLLGETHSEVYYDSGDAAFPFSRLAGAFMEQGCAAIDSVCRCDNTIFWLGRNPEGWGMVWRANGYTPQRVSTHAIENAFAGYGDLSKASAYSYQDGGHLFYVLSFPGVNNGLGATWAYDVSSGFWHERGLWNQSVGDYGRDLASCHAFCFNRHLVGDYRSGIIYEMSSGVYTDNGLPIRRLRASPDLARGGDWSFYSEFRLLVQAGVGLDAGAAPGSDPQIVLQYSDDGGFTWSNDRPRSLGKLGAYRRRVRWLRLGRSRDRCFRAICSEPVFVALLQAEVEAS